MGKSSEWVNGPNRRYVLSADDIPELERDAGVHEFINKRPRDEAESQAYDSYRRKHHIQAAAYHLAQMKATAASGSHSDAKKHRLVYSLHLRQLGYNADDHQVPEEIRQAMNDPNNNPGLRFKAHKGDAFLLNKSEPLAPPKESFWDVWNRTYPSFSNGLNKSEQPVFIELAKSDSPLEINFASNKLRQIRDWFDREKIGSIQEEDLPGEIRRQLMDFRVGRSHGGAFTRDAIQNAIENAPKFQYNWSTGLYDKAHSATQRHSKELSNVLRLDITPEQQKAIEGLGLWPTWKIMQQLSAGSGHPTNPLTAGWSRWTGSPEEGVQIDELQTDYGRPWMGWLMEAGRKGTFTGGRPVPEDQLEQFAQQLVNQHGLYDEKRRAIAKILFGNMANRPGEFLHEAFTSWARGPGGLAGAPVHIWTPEGKLMVVNKDPDPTGHFDPARPIPGHMKVTYQDTPIKRGYEEGKYGEIPTQKGPHKRMPAKNPPGSVWDPSNKTYKDKIRGEQETPPSQVVEKPKKAKKNEEVLADLKKGLAEVLKKKMAELEKAEEPEKCVDCGGRGYQTTRWGEKETCPECKGQGRKKKKLEKGSGTPTPGKSGGQPVVNQVASVTGPDASKVKPMAPSAMASIQSANRAQTERLGAQIKTGAGPDTSGMPKPAKVNLEMAEMGSEHNCPDCGSSQMDRKKLGRLMQHKCKDCGEYYLYPIVRNTVQGGGEVTPPKEGHLKVVKEEKPYTGRDEAFRRSKLPPGAPGSDKAGAGVQVDRKKQEDKYKARKKVDPDKD